MPTAVDPCWLDLAFRITSPEDFRNVALGLVAVIAGLIGLPLAVIRTVAAHRSSKAAAEQSKVAAERQVTESFTAAIGQLGSSNDLEVRLGAIYALGELAKTAPSLHWPIMEVLCAYVRKHSPRKSVPQEATPPAPQTELPLMVTAPDIEAAISVLCGRVVGQDPPDQRLDLSGSVLHSARMHGVDLRGANLRLIEWVPVVLRKANLSNADLGHADLNAGYLNGANLSRANLLAANLTMTDLTEANLGRANLLRANLHAADLTEADLTSANLSWADLREADLSKANLMGTNLRNTKFKNTVMPDGRKHTGTGPPPDLDGTD